MGRLSGRLLLICVVKATTMADWNAQQIFYYLVDWRGVEMLCAWDLLCVQRLQLRAARRRNANGRSGGFSRLRPDGV